MITIDDLNGIEANKKRVVIDCLDYLLTLRDVGGRPTPVITGYNWYDRLPESDMSITLSHQHQSEGYKQAMFFDLVKSLNYQQEAISSRVRDRGTTHLWNPDYNIRDEKGDILKGLRIKDRRIGQYIDLKNYNEPLDQYAEFKDAQGWLINELGSGWELNMPFGTEEELMRLADLFLRKSYRETVNHWLDAYKVPVILLGEEAVVHREKLSGFIQATKITLAEGGNEISFVIHKNLELLKSMEQFELLKSFGFKFQECLANKIFIEDIDGFKYSPD